jgi:predicted nucleic acid-binding protein
MLRCLEGDFGTPIIIDYVILETLTLLQQRGITGIIQKLLQFIRENRFIIFFVREESFDEAIELMLEKSEDSLSLSDCSQVVVSKNLPIGTIATFDGGLRNFFKTSVGQGYFDRLDEKEKRLLLKMQKG